MNVSLTPQLDKWVQSKVETGLYSSSSEVVRDALRVLHQFEEERAKKLNELQVGIEQFRTGRSKKMTPALIDRSKAARDFVGRKLEISSEGISDLGEIWDWTVQREVISGVV
jgi:antitoxin ParD1/3/4